MGESRPNLEETSSQQSIKESQEDQQQQQQQQPAVQESKTSSSAAPSTSPVVSPSLSPRILKRPRVVIEPPSDSERESKRMTSARSKSDSKKSSSSSSKTSKTKSDDWTEVTEPEERRRIQNRIAQRKFREKAKEHKERAERDTRNQENAGSSYHVPEPHEITDDGDVSGLPWGSVSMRYVVARGYDSESRRGSAREEYPRYDPQSYNQYGEDQQQTRSYGSRDSSGGDYSYDETSYYYPEFDQTGSGQSRT